MLVLLAESPAPCYNQSLDEGLPGGEAVVEIVVTLLKYGFLLVLAVEAGLIGRALVRLARDKAHSTTNETPSSQE